MAKLIRLPKRTVKKEKGVKIKTAKSEKELLEVLVVCDRGLFTQEIDELELAVYKSKKTSLAQLKKTALAKL